jgi:hypothetical protein
MIDQGLPGRPISAKPMNQGYMVTALAVGLRLQLHRIIVAGDTTTVWEDIPMALSVASGPPSSIPTSVTRSDPDYLHRQTARMRSLLIVLAVVALILLVIGIAVETLKFLLYIGLVVLIASAALYAVQRLRSSARRQVGITLFHTPVGIGPSHIEDAVNLSFNTSGGCP